MGCFGFAGRLGFWVGLIVGWALGLESGFWWFAGMALRAAGFCGEELLLPF